MSIYNDQLSTNYKLLLSIVKQGHRIPVLRSVFHNGKAHHDYRHWAEMKQNSNSSFEIGNTLCTSEEIAEAECHRLQVQYIEPNAPGTKKVPFKYDEGIAQVQHNIEKDKLGLAE